MNWSQLSMSTYSHMDCFYEHNNTLLFGVKTHKARVLFLCLIHTRYWHWSMWRHHDDVHWYITHNIRKPLSSCKPQKAHNHRQCYHCQITYICHIMKTDTPTNQYVANNWHTMAPMSVAQMANIFYKYTDCCVVSCTCSWECCKNIITQYMA